MNQTLPDHALRFHDSTEYHEGLGRPKVDARVSLKTNHGGTTSHVRQR